MRSDANDGEVVGVFVGDQEKIAAGIEGAGSRMTACRYWRKQAALGHRDGRDAVGE